MRKNRFLVFFNEYFPDSWKDFGWQYLWLIGGIWDDLKRPPYWRIELIFALITTPISIWLGYLLAQQELWWPGLGLLGCYLTCAFIKFIQDESTEAYVWFAIQDIFGRFIWLIASSAVVLLLWSLLSLLLK